MDIALYIAFGENALDCVIWAQEKCSVLRADFLLFPCYVHGSEEDLPGLFQDDCVIGREMDRPGAADVDDDRREQVHDAGRGYIIHSNGGAMGLRCLKDDYALGGSVSCIFVEGEAVGFHVHCGVVLRRRGLVRMPPAFGIRLKVNKYSAFRGHIAGGGIELKVVAGDTIEA